MNSEHSPNPPSSLPRIGGPKTPSIWRRCVGLLVGSENSEDTVPTVIQTDTSVTTPVPDWRRPAMLGYLVILLTFGVLGGWSAFARLDSAVVATGTVTLETSKKMIEHFEGGIIAKI